ncbi:MAG: ABC transporter substrate-binding protein, partial [Alphaproteobacteria bacterium]|nr:ABC transporter substrate-binding protein [Alphaproteobacteria bacterium]
YAAFFAWLKSARPELTTMAGCWDDDVAHSRSVWRRVVKSAAQTAGFSLQSEIKWHANAAEIEAAAKAMARSGAQVGVISAHAASACAFLRELVKEPSRPSVLIGLDSVASLEFLKDCPKEAEGLLVPTSFAPINADTERFAQEMSRRGATADMHSAAAYEILHALRRVAEGQRVHARQHAVDADRRRVRDGLGALESFDGLLGRVRLTPEGEALKPMVFVEAKDGRWRLRHRIDP